MKWLLKISYSWGDEEPYQEFNSFEEAWDTAKKYACNEAETASIEANNETCEIGLTFEKEENRGRISLHYTYDKFPYGKPQTDEVARGSGTESMAVRD